MATITPGAPIRVEAGRLPGGKVEHVAPERFEHRILHERKERGRGQKDRVAPGARVGPDAGKRLADRRLRCGKLVLEPRSEPLQRRSNDFPLPTHLRSTQETPRARFSSPSTETNQKIAAPTTPMSTRRMNAAGV